MGASTGWGILVQYFLEQLSRDYDTRLIDSISNNQLYENNGSIPVSGKKAEDS